MQIGQLVQIGNTQAETETATTHNKPHPPLSNTNTTYLKILRCFLLKCKHNTFYFPDSHVIIFLIDILYTPNHPSFFSNNFESAYSNYTETDLVMK